MTQQIQPRQMASMSQDWLARAVDAVRTALDRRFADNPDAIGGKAFAAAAPEAITRYVRHIVELAARHGFSRPEDIYALVRACIIHGAQQLLSYGVLERDTMSPATKVMVMRELAEMDNPSGPTRYDS